MKELERNVFEENLDEGVISAVDEEFCGSIDNIDSQDLGQEWYEFYK